MQNMASKKRNALVLYYSCTGNTIKLADEAATSLEKDGWSVRKSSLRNASEKLKIIPDFLVVGVPVHYWTVPSAASEMIKKMPSLDGIPAFVFCAYGGCVYHHVAQQLASELSAKGARITGGAVVLTPHSCQVSGGKRLGDIDERFGMNEPRPETIHKFSEVLISSAGQAINSAFNISPEDIAFSNAGAIARIMNIFLSLKKKISSMPEITFNKDNCTGCKKCINVCADRNFISNETGKVDMLRGTCDKCYACVANCSSGALSTNWKKIENLTRAMNKLAAGSVSIIYK